MLKGRRFWIGLVITLLFLALFLYQTDFAQMGRALSGARYAFVVPALAVYAVTMVLRTLRWQYLLDPLQRLPLRRLLAVVLVGYTANNILPVRLGELVRAYFIGAREGISKTSALATIVERTIESALYTACIRSGFPVNRILLDDGVGERVVQSLQSSVTAFGARALLQHGRSVAAKAFLELQRNPMNPSDSNLFVWLQPDGRLTIDIRSMEKEEDNADSYIPRREEA